MVLANRFGLSEMTVRKWRSRSSFEDRSHTGYHLQTTLTPIQERVAVELRKSLLLPLDDLTAVVREFICAQASRSGVDRCLRRHGVSSLKAMLHSSDRRIHKPFKVYEPGYFHVDIKYLPQMSDESSRSYLFVAIDRATRWVFVQIKSSKTAVAAEQFLAALQKACPLKIKTILTDNGKEFTDRLFQSRGREATGNHQFDKFCQAFGIEHRLTKPRHPQTNGMAERFNGRIADVLKTHHFVDSEDLQQTLLRYVYLYNRHLPQAALKSQSPFDALTQWFQVKPNLFQFEPNNHAGHDT